MTIIRTASDLKRAVIAADGHFFDRDTLNFFGDTMANYYVPQEYKEAAIFSVVDNMGEIHHCCQLRRKRPVKGGVMTPAYFDQLTFAHILPAENSVIY